MAKNHEGGDRAEETISIRVSKEYKDWANRFAETLKRPNKDFNKTQLIVDALEAYAKRKKFEPAPRRK
jgi:hypothetical protein